MPSLASTDARPSIMVQDPGKRLTLVHGNESPPLLEETRSNAELSNAGSERSALGHMLTSQTALKLRETSSYNTSNKRVTGKDLEDWSHSLQTEIFNSKLECTKQTEEQIDKLNSEVSRLSDRIEKINDDTEESLTRLGEEANILVDGCSARLNEEIKRVSLHFNEQLGKEKESYQALDMMRGVKVMAMEKRIGDNLKSFKTEFSTALSDLDARLGKSISDLGRKLESTVEALKVDVAAKFSEASGTAARELAQASASWEERDRARASQVDGLDSRFAREMEAMDTKLRDFRTESRNLLNEGKNELFSKLTQETTQHEVRIDCLEDQCRGLDLAVAAAANVPTRRIEWSLRNVMEKASPAENSRSAPAFTWRSVAFDAAGTNDLRVELRHLPRNTGRLDKGDCILLLWAPKDLFLIFRLSVGEHTVQLEHRFSGEEPFTSDRVCFLKDEVNADDDSLRVGIEVLEAVSQPPDTRSFRGPSDDDDRGACVEADMTVYRYLNNRVLELVQDRVDGMSSRMVRRIEWRIEQASSLRRYFADGESICSSNFDAASLKDLQFVFYPLGYPGAREGYCSLFLYCPDGSLLKCWLSIGKVRKEVRMSSDQQGYLGRTNFCRWDTCMEADDSVLLALEIVEARRTETEAMVHQVAASAEPPKSPDTVSSIQQRTPRVSEMDGAAAISSVMRMQQTPAGRLLEDVRKLPSIWTATPPGNISNSLEGFHNFSAMTSVRRPVSSRGRASSIGCSRAEGDLRTPRTSRAAAARRYDMYVK
mmetsp:Transcript_25513/g.79539  ORF Transcript_25513/g.79539 Transcript_25513/m.79539 type:complete len:768 (+) Transcript_25513:41-2344(+)